MDAKFGTFGIAVNTFSGATSRVARWYIFSNQKKSQIGYILEGLGMENAGIFHDFAAILYILLPFYIFCGHLVSFSSFGMFGPRKIWQPRFTTSTLYKANGDRGHSLPLLGSILWKSV
jgi:hypothetical protein